MYQIFITYLIVILGTINLIRIGFFMIGSDIYAVLDARRQKLIKKKRLRLPTFSVIIPAHNEEGIILHSLQSVVDNHYPKSKLQIIIADDGSTDNTAELVNDYKKRNPKLNLEIWTQANSGKAHALNNAILNYATGELVMCLDADSTLDKNALKAAAEYFIDRRVVAMAANVKIRPMNTLLNLIQRYEYIIGYQMKRALTVFNIEYIIGGIGSVFRRQALKKVGFYDTNTMTEDIDLSMKILQNGGKDWRVIYGARVIAYTESVIDLAGLIRQRYRWKYGRAQTFYKNRNLFFNSDRKHNRFLTWFYLPYAIFCEFTFLLEPLMLSYIMYVVIRYSDFVTLLTSLIIVGGYITMNVLMETTIPLKERLKFAVMAPSMYIFFYFLSFIEYVALIQGLFGLRKLKQSIDSGVSTWQHVERAKIA